MTPSIICMVDLCTARGILIIERTLKRPFGDASITTA